MNLKEFLNSFSENNNEKTLQKFTDSILDFFIIKTPKAIAKGTIDTYSWMKDGIMLIQEKYRQVHDEKQFVKMYKQKEKNGTNFCEHDYRAGNIVCKYSKWFYDKSFMRVFCNKPNQGPDLSLIIKKKGSNYHKGYCVCNRIKNNKIQ